MNIFSRLFGLSSKDKRNYKDKTPYKVQIMRNALVKKAKKAVLTPLEKTYLTGYLNPAYHYATEPRKRK